MSGDATIRFEDGAAYERMMGGWSRIAGGHFLDWVAPAPGQRWVDVGCGNGAFTALLAERCAPADLRGLDPSPAQIAYARQRPGLRPEMFEEGNALALPYPDASFDAAVMALVLFFVPEPAKGLSEMVRVTRPGGSVSAYVWDVPGGGLPMEPLHDSFRALGITPLLPPQAKVSTIPALAQLWTEAGLEDVQTQVIPVERTFESFDDYWTVMLMAPSVVDLKAQISEADIARMHEEVRHRLGFAETGPVTATARAHAVKGRRPA